MHYAWNFYPLFFNACTYRGKFLFCVRLPTTIYFSFLAYLFMYSYLNLCFFLKYNYILTNFQQIILQQKAVSKRTRPLRVQKLFL